MRSEFQVGQVSFSQQGLTIGYFTDDDVRVGGHVFMEHQLSLSAKHPDYADDIEALHTKALRVLKNALEDFEESEPFTPADKDDDDSDEKGMGE